MVSSLNIPVLFVAFNRPDTTERVFEEIRKARPKKLFVSVDGPREGNQKDRINVKKVREIVKKVDWPCRVKTIIRGKNKGSLKATIGSIDWFFENVKEGIILEDDCLPSQDFFRFCSELLNKYRNDDRVMHISGNNFQRGWKRDNYSYYFSKYPYMWGWATWRMAWKKYKVDLELYSHLKKKKYFSDIYPNKLEERYIKHLIDSAYFIDPSGWDNHWIFTLLINNGLSIVPNENLVRNIGFIEDSVRTKPVDSFLSIPTKKMKFPLKHPSFIIRDGIADEKYFNWILRNKLKKHFLLKTGLYKFLKK